MAAYPFRPRFGEPLWGPGSQWTRRLREQSTRQVDAAHQRVVDRLGAEWHVIDWQSMRPPALRPKTELPGFLVVGPGGLFCVGTVSHGRSRVLMAGDIIQVNGKRPHYVHMARRDARYVAKVLSDVIGYEINVFAMLAFVGKGLISVNGLPKDCMLTTYRELPEVLGATGRRLSAQTAHKLAHVARTPAVWETPPAPVTTP